MSYNLAFPDRLVSHAKSTTLFVEKGIPMSQFYEFTMDDIDGHSVSFERYRDQVCLVYNGASE